MTGVLDWDALSEEALTAVVGRGLQGSTDMVLIADLTLTARFASSGVDRVLGYAPEDIIGRRTTEFVHPDELPMVAAVTTRASDGYSPQATGIFRCLHANGQYVAVELNGGAFVLDGEIVGFWMVGRRPLRTEVFADVLSRVLAEEPLSQSLSNLSILLPGAGEKFCITCWGSQEPTFTVGQRLPPALSGRDRPPGSPWDIACRQRTDCVVEAKDLPENIATLAGREGFGAVLVTPIIDIRGEPAAVMTLWTPVGMAADPAAATIGIRQLVEAAIAIRLQMEDLRRSARSDSLTGLANRLAFHDSLEEDAQQKESAVLYIDLDGFKAINDTYGHAVGDALLQVAAERIESCVRSRDLVARLGGDEFAVLGRTLSRDETAAMATRILDSMREPIMLDGNTLHVRASIGVATAARADRALLSKADEALYEAKRGGRDRVCYAE